MGQCSGIGRCSCPDAFDMLALSPVRGHDAHFRQCRQLRKSRGRLQVDRSITMMGAEMNAWVHLRQPTPLDQQTVIRMNRDTLYSLGIVDISEGASVTIPDSSGRYMTVMVINEDGYLNRVFHDPGEHPLTVEEFGSTFVLVAARTLADPTDPGDLAVAHRLQDGLTITALANRPWSTGQYNKASYEATKKPLLELGQGLHDSKRTFGPKEHVDPVRFLIGLAGGFGGLPEDEAFYAIKAQPLPVGRFRLTVKDPPLDGFWSVSIYNKDGYFQENEYDLMGLGHSNGDRVGHRDVWPGARRF